MTRNDARIAKFFLYSSIFVSYKIVLEKFSQSSKRFGNRWSIPVSFTANGIREAHPRTQSRAKRHVEIYAERHGARYCGSGYRWTNGCFARAGRVIKSTLSSRNPGRAYVWGCERIIRSGRTRRTETFTSACNALFLISQ